MLTAIIVLVCFYVATWLVLRRWKRQDNNQDQMPYIEDVQTPVEDLPPEQKMTVSYPYNYKGGSCRKSQSEE